jgi:4-alpha-glucanotransferase
MTVKSVKRRAGILLSISSLASPGGGGTIGKEAFSFVDFLMDAGQNFWQILPIGPVGETFSPYQSRSAFAFNTDFIDRKTIRRDPERYLQKGALYRGFLKDNTYWLDGYAMFEAVRASLGGSPLPYWPDELRNPSAETLLSLKDKYKAEIDSYIRDQYCFFLQWRELKRYANLKGIGLIGDLPIYVYEDSADFWLRRKLFDVDKKGLPISSAGVPPDAFSKDGQVWNNPVYDWNKNKKEVTAFWRERLKQASYLYDGVRVDHFRAFADYYVIRLGSSLPDTNASSPLGAKAAKRSAKNGEWRTGPGLAFTDMIHKEFPGFLIIAEDLGNLSETAKKFVKECGFPGMSVMQFAFTEDPANPYLPHNVKENTVCYTGTHDNDTILGWLSSSSKKERMYAMEYFGLSVPEDLPKVLTSAVLASKAEIAIIPLQDWLGLGSDARMNKPGTVGGINWKWKIPVGALSRRLASRIRRTTKELYNR